MTQPIVLSWIDRFEIGRRVQPGSAEKLLLDATLIVLGSLLIGILAQLRVHLPFTPVPITGQTLGVLLVGSSLGLWRGTSSVALYLVEGLVGLPVFASSSVTGFSAFLLPSSGYLFGFVLASACVGHLSQRGWDRNWKRASVMFFLGHACVFFIGVPWLASFVGPENALKMGYFPFIPGEIIKTLLAARLISLCRGMV